MKRTVIIVAGGKGLRMGKALPKQFIPVHGKPVLMHTLRLFYDWDNGAKRILVIPAEHEEYWNMLCSELDFSVPHEIVHGGETRFHSVRNALRITDKDGLIAVHDGVRPLVSAGVVESCFSKAGEFGAAIPVVPVIESVREKYDGGNRHFDRNRLCVVQTPQVFRAAVLHDAYRQEYDPAFTDDASVVEYAGHKIHLVGGNRENIKITTPHDLVCAEFLLG